MKWPLSDVLTDPTIEPPTPEALVRAAHRLTEGELVAFPTETVYGLGADATNSEAIAKLFVLKGRPRFNPLIVHVRDLAMAEAQGVLGDKARTLAEAFWPGPLTLVVPKAEGATVSDLACAGLPSVGLRAPSHPVAQALLDTLGRPIAAPSANPSGRLSPTTAVHVAEGFRGHDLPVLDGGPCRQGLESTIVGLTGPEPVLLRPGAVARAELERRIGPLASPDSEGVPQAPGNLESHYAPNAPVRLEARSPRPGEALLAFGPAAPPHLGPMLNLSPRADLVEAAVNLFAFLRQLDALEPTGIAVMHIPSQGLGEAINDRLRRAAAAHNAGAS